MGGTADTSLISCDSAQCLHWRRLDGEALSERESAALERHWSDCAACCSLAAGVTAADQSLRRAYAPALTPWFSRRVMARMPAQAAPRAASPARAFAVTANAGGWSGRWGRIAAMLAVCLGAALMARQLLRAERVPAAAVLKGQLADASGAAVRVLRESVAYRVRETTVLQLGEGRRIKAECGSELRLAPGTDAQPGVVLTSGDLYAAVEGQRPVRVACADFWAEVQAGDAFVAQENSEARRGVVIVFEGFTQVTPHQNEPLALSPGQVFISFGLDDLVLHQTLRLADLPSEEARQREAPAGDPAQLRAAYVAVVQSYRRELSHLKEQIENAPPGSPETADLSDRRHRIDGYLQTHQQRLESLHGGAVLQIPSEQIKRGVDRYMKPGAWL